MTLLVGTSDTSTFTNTGDNYNFVGGTRMYVRKMIARRSGTATSLKLYVFDFDVQSMKLAIYDGAGTLLAVSAAVNTGAPGVVSASISDTTIVAGQQYYLGVIGSGSSGAALYADNTLDADYSTAGTYASPPSSLGSITDDNGYNRYMMYADGTVAGAGTNPYRYSVAHTTITSASASWTVNLPDCDDGDLLIFHFSTNSNANSQSGNFPSGVTQVGTDLDVSTDSTAVLLKKIASSEGATLAFTNLWDATESGSCYVESYKGQHATTPVDQVGTPTSTNGTSVAGPSVTPSVDNCLIVQYVSTDPSATTYTGTADSSPTGVEVFDFVDTGSLAFQFIQEYRQSTAAAIALDATGLTSDDYGHFQIAIAPAAGGGGVGIPIVMHHRRMMQNA